jgi:hypothetical protein
MANNQNVILQSQLASVSSAVAFLASINLSIKKILLGEGIPRIEIACGGGCRQLQSGHVRHIIRDGRRLSERLTLVEGCQVRWTENH